MQGTRKSCCVSSATRFKAFKRRLPNTTMNCRSNSTHTSGGMSSGGPGRPWACLVRLRHFCTSALTGRPSCAPCLKTRLTSLWVNLRSFTGTDRRRCRQLLRAVGSWLGSSAAHPFWSLCTISGSGPRALRLACSPCVVAGCRHRLIALGRRGERLRLLLHGGGPSALEHLSRRRLPRREGLPESPWRRRLPPCFRGPGDWDGVLGRNGLRATGAFALTSFAASEAARCSACAARAAARNSLRRL
mmetsp:Transcript_37866/g.113089  ORF Transcript_37866/g.113089 Transcript_37866/m.113089 type:complete len:245 (-) Transcript_37866:470-1204(-)